MQVKPVERWLRLALGGIVLLLAGIIYAWSILKMPLAEAFGWDAAQLGLNYTITICFFCIGGFFSGLLSRRLSARIRLVGSAVLVFSGFFITSVLPEGASPALLYLAYGVLAGAGIGIVYNAIISVTNAWFPDKKGLCSGILMMAFGFSSLILGRMADAFIQDEAVGWRATILMLAIAAGVVQLAAAFLVKTPPQGTIFPEPKRAAGKGAPAVAIEKRDYTAGEVVRRSSFWRMFVYLTLLAAVGSAAISFARDMITDVGGSMDVAVTMVGVLAIFNGLGRLSSGALFDRLGVHKTLYITGVIAVAAPLVIVLALVTGSTAIGIAGLCLSGMSYGFAPTTSAAFANVYFGMKNFSINFSLLNLILIPSSFAATIAGQIKTSTGAFTTTFIILAVASVIGQVAGLSVRKPLNLRTEAMGGTTL